MSAPHPRQAHHSQAHSSADLRLPRAAVFAAVCVALSAAGHVLASSEGVPLWTLAVGFVAAFCVVVPLAGRERSLPGIAATLSVGQIALHAVFGIGQFCAMSALTADASVVARARRLLCGAHGTAALSPDRARALLEQARIPVSVPSGPHTGMPGMPGMPGMTGCSMSLLPSLPMLIGHVLAGATAGWLLRHGDLALSRIARLSRIGVQEVAEGALVRSLRAAVALVRALRAGLPTAA
ncbi:hypothetical protein, partial [Streptomyces beihaiensis]